MRVEFRKLFAGSVIAALLCAIAAAAVVGRGDSGGDDGPERGAEIRDPSPARAGPEAVCEADATARCWYVAADAGRGGDGSFESPFRIPQQANDVAGPGDYIYLRGAAEHGEFTSEHAGARTSIWLRGGRDGEEGAVITVKSYPGEQAVLRGTSPRDRLEIRNMRSYRRFENLRIIHGILQLKYGFEPGVHHLWAVGNHVSDVAAPAGNFGLIFVELHQQEAPEGNPHHVFIHDNVVHDLSFDDGGTIRPWTEGPSTHHGCIAVERADNGPVEIVGNELFHCPLALFTKMPSTAPILYRENRIHDVRRVGVRTLNNTWERNRIGPNAGVWELGAGLGDVFGSGPNVYVARGNTVIGIPIGWPEAVVENAVFRDNVVFVPSLYHDLRGWTRGARVQWARSDIDGNCVIAASRAIAARGPRTTQSRTWEEYRAEFGHDRRSVRIIETSPHRVFADPDGGDYSLIGVAAERCAGKGIG